MEENVVLPQKSYSWLTKAAMLVLTGFACTQSSSARAVRSEFELASIMPANSGESLAIMRPPAGGGLTATNANPLILTALA
jgi:hypothetical protein